MNKEKLLIRLTTIGIGTTLLLMLISGCRNLYLNSAAALSANQDIPEINDELVIPVESAEFLAKDKEKTSYDYDNIDDGNYVAVEYPDPLAPEYAGVPDVEDYEIYGPVDGIFEAEFPVTEPAPAP